MRIALFITCVADTLFPETGIAVVRVLERLGHEVVFPAEQTCCGQMHVNSGYRDDALRLARRFVDVMGRDDGVDAVVSPSSSCVGWVRELLPGVAREAGDERLAADAEALGGRLFELSELLVRRLGVEDVGAAYPRRVTLHPTCHSQRVTRIGDAPQRLLANVRGLELLELPEATECCGFGGTFSVKNAGVSLAMLEDKCRNILATGAEVVTAVDPSCLLHIGGGLSRLAPAAPGGRGPAVRAVHLAQILAAEAARVSRAHDFPAAAREALADAQLRANLRGATQTIRARRAAAVAELPDFEELREQARRVKDDALDRLDELLARFEAAATAAGAQVHHAADAGAANAIVAAIARDHGVTELVKMKSLATDEIGLDAALAAAGVEAVETDLAELIVQLAGDTASHILVPAVHYSRGQVRDLFQRTIARGRRALRRPERARRGLAPVPARALPARRHGRHRRQRRRRRDGHRLRGRERGQRPHVHHAAAGARHRHGHREGRRDAGRPRAAAAPAAALGDRGADELLRVAPDRGRRPATDRGSTTSCCSTTGAATRWPTRWAGRRCAASAAAPA